MGQSNKELIALPFQGRAKSPPQAEIGRGFSGGGLHDALQGEVIVYPIKEQVEIFPHTTYESFAIVNISLRFFRSLNSYTIILRYCY